MGDISGILHRVVDAAHLFQVKLEIFDEKIENNEFSEAKLILSQLEQYLLYLFNPLSVSNIECLPIIQDYKSDLFNDELKDLIEEFIATSKESDMPGVCLYVFADHYNKRFLQFQEKLLNHTLLQFKLAFTNSKYNVNSLKELTLIGNSNYLNKSIHGIEKILTAQLSLVNTSSNSKSVIKSKDLNKCKIEEFLDVIGVLRQLDTEFARDLIYYAFQIICKNLISEFDHLEAGEIIDAKIPKTLHFDPNVEFAKFAHESMSFHYITIASNFFETEEGFSCELFTNKLSKFSQLVHKLINDCEGLHDHEFSMRIRMIMACICAYSSSFGKLINENKDDIERLLYIFTTLTLIRKEISKMALSAPYRPIIASLDFSQSVSELALKEMLRKLNNEMALDMNKGFLLSLDVIGRLSAYPALPAFNRAFNFIVDVIHLNLIRFIYKSLDIGDYSDLLDKSQGIMEKISQNRPPLVHRDSELRAKSRILLKILDNRNVDILEYTGCFFSDDEVIHLRKLLT